MPSINGAISGMRWAAHRSARGNSACPVPSPVPHVPSSLHSEHPQAEVRTDDQRFAVCRFCRTLSERDMVTKLDAL